MPKELIIELPEKIKATHVLYADAPLGLNRVPQQITIDELYQKVGQPFTYSDTLFSKEKHAPYLKENIKQKTTTLNYFKKKFDQIGITDLSSFVICNMDTLGHGVFANRDFEPGECFILYTGVIVDNSNSKNASPYAFAYGKEISLSVDAAETGNISRFIQHMPMNYNLLSLEERKKLDSDEKQAQFQLWQWRNIKYGSGLTENDVAWANLSIMIIPISGVPCLIVCNPNKIKKGDQLGISYGYGYWLRREIKPELFYLNGKVIPESEYGYKEIILDLPLIELFSQFPDFQKIGVQKSYTAAMFQKDLQRQQEVMQPVWFSHLAEPVSIFKLRELLLQYNVIGKKYDHIENEFVSQLRNILPKEFKVKMFERDPQQRSQKPMYDVVCTTDDLMKWSQLTSLLKGPLISSLDIKNKCLKLTQEVILMDIDNDLQNQLSLLTILQNIKQRGFFEKDLDEEFILAGPTRRDPRGLIKPQSDEGINQIIFHNPGLTKQEINNAYKLVENTFNSAANASPKNNSTESKNKIKLNTVTSTFFKNKLPASWKNYPPEKLTGRYKEHEVVFFTLPKEQSLHAEPFFNALKQEGFGPELKRAGEKPSLVVDLTTLKM